MKCIVKRRSSAKKKTYRVTITRIKSGTTVTYKGVVYNAAAVLEVQEGDSLEFGYEGYHVKQTVTIFNVNYQLPHTFSVDRDLRIQLNASSISVIEDGGTWLLSSSISGPSITSTVKFKSRDVNYLKIKCESTALVLTLSYIGDGVTSSVYTRNKAGSGGWTTQEYRTIHFLEPLSDDLYTWLSNNATQQYE